MKQSPPTQLGRATTMKHTAKAIRIILWLLAALLLLAACSEPSPPAPLADATPTIPPASPQRVESPTAPRSAEPASTAAPALAASPTPMPGSTPAPSRAIGSGPLPDLLAQIPLAPVDARLHDLLLDSAAGHLYVTDTADNLHVLDAATYDELATLPASGALTLDAVHGRLYASPQVEEGDLTVVDTDSLTVLGTVSPGGFVTVDGERDRFYVGNQVYASMPEDTPGVRVYDGATLDKLGEVPQPGIPVYNPLREELYVVAYTVHIADPEGLQITGDLFPEITDQSPAWCNGCLAATDAYVYPDRNLLLVEVTTLSAGKGPGTLPPPRFFDASTLEELTDLAGNPALERGCGRPILAEPVEGRVYRDERYSRYVYYNNLLVYDLVGSLETWRDGLSLGVTNPRTGQMYVPHGDDTLILDLAALLPVGTLPPGCIHTVDSGAGRIYALGDRDLLIFSEEGGWPEPPATGDAGSLPADEIHSIQPSPDYARDRTLFATGSGKLYRSADGGKTWAQLRGGLPEGVYLTLDLAVSPDFAADRTLFAGGFRQDFWGEGVYRSTDGGDTWQPMWRDLTHLRVYDVALSATYAADGTLLAYSRYQRLTPWEGRLSLFRSTDRGLSWTLVMTQTGDTPLPPPEEFLPRARSLPAVQFREADYGQAVERTTDGGETWQPVNVTRQPEFYVQAILTSPNFAADRTVYVLSEYDLFRSTDAGDTWARWRDERLVGRDYANNLSAAASSPRLDGGRYQLFVGTVDGEIWSLDPAALTWEPVQVAEQWPTVLQGEWVGEIETSPGGDVWLGTWGSGLARYADGEIQARYTVTDGLPTQYLGGIAIAPDGALWAGGDLPPSMAHFDGQDWTPRPFPADVAIGGVLDVTVGADGAVWVGAQAPGLLYWTEHGWEIIPDPEALTGWRIYDIEIDADGTLWSATARGLAFHSDGAWSGQGGAETKAVEFGPNGTTYLLASGGSVWRYAGGQWTELPAAPQTANVLSSLALHVAADGAVWLGTYDGAFRFDGQSWRQFTAQDGLPANSVVAIAQDAEGWLWFGTENGAARVDPATLDLSPVDWPVAPTGTPPSDSTPTSQVAPTPTPCAGSPAAPFAAAYAQARIAGRLGCPTSGAATTRAAFQPFEGGSMFWQDDEQAIYVLDAGSAWVQYADTWDSSQPADDPALVPPDGLWQPVRGFGKVWREQLGGPQATTGWALAGEMPFEMQVQSFAGGQMFTGPGERVFVLYADGFWDSQEQP